MPSSTALANTANDAAVDVILFGWADCQPAHVAKYASLYPAGSNSLVVPSKLSDFFLRSTPWLAQSRTHTAPVLGFLHEHGHLAPMQADPECPSPARGRPLILHCFSNGGVLSLLTALLAVSLSGHQLARAPAALILDSAPNPRTADALRESASLLTMPLPRVVQPLVRGIVYAGMLLVDVVVHRWLGVRPRLDVNCDALVAHPDLACVPKLVLYSLGDQFVRPWHVEKFLTMLTPALEELADGKVVPVGGYVPQNGEGEEDKVIAYSVMDGQLGYHAGVEQLGANAAVNRALPHGGLVSVVRFPKDSPHVQHMRKYPTEYQTAVTRFAEKTR